MYLKKYFNECVNYDKNNYAQKRWMICCSKGKSTETKSFKHDDVLVVGRQFNLNATTDGLSFEKSLRHLTEKIKMLISRHQIKTG